jgi:hypothetical protein
MNRQSTSKRMAVTGMLAATLAAFPGAIALAHCDSINGPVIPEAVIALDNSDVTPVLKWVSGESEAEIRAAFDQAQIVRAKGTEAQQLADQHFLETLVRLHRAGEGAPYTGITDAPVEPIIAMADDALAEGSADEMIRRINRHLAQSIREKFQRVSEARGRKDDSVEAGREFVAAYVNYVHYVEGVHAAIVSAGGHQH